MPKLILMLVVFALAIGACKKDKGDPALLEEAPKDTFIPRMNTKYEYRISEDGVATATATKWIDGGKDSSGIKLYNLHTNIASPYGDMALDNKLYVASGKTYTSFNMPDAWFALVAELKKNPGVEVIEARTTGFPGYMIMENSLKEGSKLTWEVPGKTGQYLKYIQKASGSNVTMTQEITQEPGTVTAVETITVPAGSFNCSKFVYNTSQKQEISVDGGQKMVRTGTENLTVWMAHGIGVVKQEAVTTFAGTTTNSSIVLINTKK